VGWKIWPGKGIEKKLSQMKNAGTSATQEARACTIRKKTREKERGNGKEGKWGRLPYVKKKKNEPSKASPEPHARSKPTRGKLKSSTVRADGGMTTCETKTAREEYPTIDDEKELGKR